MEDVESIIRRIIYNSKWSQFEYRENLIRDLLLICYEFMEVYNQNYNEQNFESDFMEFLQDETMMDKLCKFIEKTEKRNVFQVPEITIKKY